MDQLEKAMAAFDAALEKWLAAGGDKRLLDFTPLKDWYNVVKLMAERERQTEQRSTYQ